MNRLSRVVSKTMSNVRIISRQLKKDYNEMVYDLKRLPKRTLEMVYNGVLFVSVMAPTGVYILYNTVYLNRYQQLVSLRVKGNPLPLEENLELLALREWNVSHIARQYKLMDLMEFFLCSGTQVFSAGDLCTRCGAIVGLPHNFSYNTIDDVKVNEISILGVNATELQADEESAQDFQQLIESLVLSENAKKFAITRELHMTSNDRVMNGIFIAVISLFFGVGIGQQIILSRNIRRRYLLSVCIRLVSAAIGLTLFLVIREMIYYGWDKAADEAAIKQGNAYFEGAVEYYTKLIQRQEALDNLMAKNKLKGESLKDSLLSLLDVKGVSNSKRLERVLELDPTDSEETPA